MPRYPWTMGGFSPADLEGEAEATYRRLGLDPAEPTDPVTIAELILGPGSVRSVRASALPGFAALVRVSSSWRIYVRESVPRDRRSHAVAHELGHAVLDDASEADCDLFGAALLAPRRAVVRALRHVGADWSALAHIFGISQTCAALRLSEVNGQPIALVAPRRVRVRGEDFAWPETEEEIRRLVNVGHQSVERFQLTDEPRRFVLCAR